MSRLFDGDNDRLSYVAGAIITAAPVGFSCWVRRSRQSSASEEHIMVAGAVSATNNMFVLGINTSNQVFARTRTSSNADAIQTANTVLNDGQWHHIALQVVSATSRFAWVDGVKSAENTTNRTPTGINAFYIGANTSNTPSNEFAGNIAYPTVVAGLSDADIADLYAAGAGADPRDVISALAFWPLQSNADPEPDEVGTFDLSTSASGELPAFSSDEPFILDAGQLITHSGRSTAAVYGTHTLANVAARTLGPVGNLGTAAVYGTHTIAPPVGAQPIVPSGIASAGVFGTHAFANVAARTLGPVGNVASAAVYGTFVIAVNAGIASAAKFGTHQIAESGFTLTLPAGIAHAGVFGTHTLDVPPLVITPDVVEATTVFGSHTVAQITPGAVSPSGVASAAVYGTHLIELFRIKPTGVPTGARLGLHKIFTGTGAVTNSDAVFDVASGIAVDPHFESPNRSNKKPWDYS